MTTVSEEHETHVPDVVKQNLEQIMARHPDAQLPPGVVPAADEGNNAQPAPQEGNTDLATPVAPEAKPLTPPDVVDPQPAPPQAPVQQGDLPVATDRSTLPEDIQKQLHGYDVLKGKYSAEVPVFQTDLRKERAKVELLQEELEKARSATPEAPAGQQNIVRPDQITDEELAAFGVTEQNLEDYGPEFWKQQIAIQKNQAMQIQSQMTQIQAQATPEQMSQEEATFFSSMDGLVPQWREINNSREFERFLTEQDPVVGMSYGDLLNDAADSNNAVRTAAIFKVFMDSVSQSTGALPAPAVPQQVNVSLPSVQSQVVPSTSPHGQGPAQKRIYTPQEWKAAMISLTTGKVRGERAVALEKELNAATQEGRVR